MSRGAARASGETRVHVRDVRAPRRGLVRRHLSEPSCVCLTGLREAHARVAGWVDGRGEPCGSHGFVRRRFRRSVGRSPAGPAGPATRHALRHAGQKEVTIR